MKQYLLYFLSLFAVALFGQNNDEISDAIKLHAAGNFLLQKDELTLFDKLQALDKFQQSHKLFQQVGATDKDIYEKNELERKTLIDFFQAYQNSDSLLHSTLFYPDSVFQQKVGYASTFKEEVRDYLAFNRSAKRSAFFKLRDLNYQIDGRALTFENYWALEVIEFERWFKQLETRISAFPKKARGEIRQLELSQKFSTLRNKENTNYLEQTKDNLQGKLTQITEAKDLSESAYSRLKTIGYGLLGALLLFAFWLRKKSIQLVNSKNQLLWEEKKRSEDLLSNILPAEVVRELKSKGVAKAQKKESVSVLFSDFINFSQTAETLSPEELVRELDYCFTVFDRIIEKHRLQKIKTIGDAYMCVGGLYTRGGNHLHRMIYAALEIQQFLMDRKRKQLNTGGHFFEARIGIHVGPVVAGVIGRKKIAFDVWGNTVNVAQQMEHHSEAGKVNISGDIFEFVNNRFDCHARGKITAKNKQVYEMYFVEGIVT